MPQKTQNSQSKTRVFTTKVTKATKGEAFYAVFLFANFACFVVMLL